jgi:hypothetical protein
VIFRWLVNPLFPVIYERPHARLRRVRLLTTLRFGVLVSVPAAASLLAVSGCGGESACTTIGCQSDTQTTGGQGGGSASGGSGQFIAGDNPGAGGRGLGEGEVCQEVNLSAQASPVNVLILLDRSTSMLERVDRTQPDSPTRWDAVTAALRAFVTSPAASQARVGLQFFGLMLPDDCSVEKYMTPAVPIAPLATNQAALLEAINNARPDSLTPTAPAVAGSLAYARQVAELPENVDVPTVMVLASDGIPSECGPEGPNGEMIVSFREIIDTLEEYSTPELDAQGDPVRPSVRTYIVGTEELKNNADALAEAGAAEAFLVGGGVGLASSDLEAQFLDALLSIVVKPLDCELDVPQTAPDSGEAIDFDKVRVRFTGVSGTTTEFPRTSGANTCGVDQAWFYEAASPPQKIFFCRRACEALGAGDLKLELGCAPQIILR